MDPRSRGAVLIVVGTLGLLRGVQLIGEARVFMIVWNITISTVILLWSLTDRLEKRRSFVRYGRAWAKLRRVVRSAGS